ncbi:MAG: hypothetical protein WCX95_04350 [Candidatus Gracilibacteria bacterium]
MAGVSGPKQGAEPIEQVVPETGEGETNAGAKHADLADLGVKPTVEATEAEGARPEPAVPEDPTIVKAIDGVTVQTSRKAMKALRIARKKKRKESIADQEIDDPERAYKNFEEAIDLVKRHIPGFLRFKVDDIKFQKLAGDVVGKSTEDGIIIDPIMLLHPVMRLATVIFHETLHAGNRVQNEGLVQAQAEMYFGGVSNLKEYDDAVAKFTKFADIYGNGDIESAAKKIYKLYYRAVKNNDPSLYKKIYEKFAKKAGRKKYFVDDSAIKKFFGEVFPELKMVEAA